VLAVAVTDGGAAPDAPGGPFIIIQEDQKGFDAVDGKILPRQGSTTITGYTGTGFADGDTGLGKTISWSINVATAGTYQLAWRYAFGGAAANTRDARLVVNGVALDDTVTFPYTTDWTNWQESAAIPVYSKLQKLHLPHYGYGDILPRYAGATGGEVFSEFSHDNIEVAYARATLDARNQYTLGYTTRATPSSTYRDIEVKVARPGLKVSAKSGYYPLPAVK